MNKLKNLFLLSQILYFVACMIFCLFIDNKPIDAQITPPLNKESPSINSSSNNTPSEKSSGKDSSVIAIFSAVASLISGGVVAKIQEERIKRLKETLEGQEKKTNSKIQEMEAEFQKTYNSGEVQKKLNTDFYALVFCELGDINMTGLSDLHKENESKKELSCRLNKCHQEFESSIRAIDGLLSSDGKGTTVLKYIAYNAIGQKNLNNKEEYFKNKVKHLYSYLRCWLICSIRYNTDKLPVKWIKDEALSKNEKMEALSNAKNMILNDEQIKKYIPDKSSKKLICTYIDILIEKI